jgi:hypothetical protein
LNEDLLVISDATKDPRFKNNPLVTDLTLGLTVNDIGGKGK